MALVSSTNVNDCTAQIEVVIFGGNLLFKNRSLLLRQVFHGQVLILHLLEQILLSEGLLTVLSHVDLHGELAIVVDFELGHGVEVEFESFEDKEKDVGHALDAAPLESIDLLLALLTVIGVVALEHLSLDEGLEALLD